MQLLYLLATSVRRSWEASSRIVAPIREVSPISPRAAEGIDTLETYGGPQPGFAEQVYRVTSCSPTSRAAPAVAMFYNHVADRPVSPCGFNRNELPCFTVWKNTGALEDGYVTGLEPATNYPNFKAFERQQGRVVLLPPGGHWEASWSMEVHDSAAGVAGVLAEVVSLQSQARAVLHRTPQARFSAQAEVWA